MINFIKFAILFLPLTFAFSEDIWKADLSIPIKIGQPVCKGDSVVNLMDAPSYKLCLPTSAVKNLILESGTNQVVLRSPGYITGPVLIRSNPPVILVGSMKINKGSMNFKIAPEGGFEMRGNGGMFEIEGLVVPLPVKRSLSIEKVELEFTSPDDARVEIFASGQSVSIPLKARIIKSGYYKFEVSRPGNSVFPNNPFFHNFEGKSDGDKFNLVLEDGIQIDLFR